MNVMTDNGFLLKFLEPHPSLTAFVENIGMFHNQSTKPKEVVVLPDGRIDLFFWKPGGTKLQVLLVGLETTPEQRLVPPHTVAFVISFKPLGVEYILESSVADIINSAKALPDDLWSFHEGDFEDFDNFYQRVTAQLTALMPVEMDSRKVRLFDLIYHSNGEMPVSQLAEQSGWSSRQINRYFNQQFGLSLKTYCNVLRFKASLAHIAQGKLFPQLNFTDQAYFIKAVKRFAGVVPKELSANKNDRFLLLSVLKQR